MLNNFFLRFRNGLKILLTINLLKTLWFNFKMFPFQDAVKLPVFLYGKIRFINLSGKVIIRNPLYRGMIKIGTTSMETMFYTRECTSLYIAGHIIFEGKATICMSCQIVVRDKGVLLFSEEVKIGHLSRIICFEKIMIGEKTRIAWESQIMDTNFHYFQNVETGEIPKLTQPVVVGKKNWIGNRVNIMKGTITPDYCIIASNSLCNKDYSDLPEYPLIAGVPAKLVNRGYRRIDAEDELDLMKKNFIIN